MESNILQLLELPLTPFTYPLYGGMGKGQGGVISSTLCNIALNGIDGLLTPLALYGRGEEKLFL